MMFNLFFVWFFSNFSVILKLSFWLQYTVDPSISWLLQTKDMGILSGKLKEDRNRIGNKILDVSS